MQHHIKKDILRKKSFECIEEFKETPKQSHLEYRQDTDVDINYFKLVASKGKSNKQPETDRQHHNSNLIDNNQSPRQQADDIQRMFKDFKNHKIERVKNLQTED